MCVYLPFDMYREIISYLTQPKYLLDDIKNYVKIKDEIKEYDMCELTSGLGYYLITKYYINSKEIVDFKTYINHMFKITYKNNLLNKEFYDIFRKNISLNKKTNYKIYEYFSTTWNYFKYNKFYVILGLLNIQQRNEYIQILTTDLWRG